MDQQILFLINQTWTNPVLDIVMAAASSFDFWWPFLLVGGVAGVIFGDFRLRAMILAIGISIGITDALVVDNLKSLVGRPRPHEAVKGVRTLDLAKATPRFLALSKPLKSEVSDEKILPPGGNSFPSGHAANNFALATICACFYRRWGWLVFLPATLVAYSRIYVGAHWPMDVLVSCLIGAGIALLTVAAFEAAWQRWGARLMPKSRSATPSLLEA